MATFTLLGGRLTLLDVPPRPSEDALWLAASVPLLPQGSTVLDAACGCGVAGLALLERQPGLRLTAVDIDPTLTDLTGKNAMLNGTPVATLTADVLNLPPLGPFAAVVCNPPFYPAETHPASATRGSAHSLPQGALPGWLTALTGVLQPGGSLHMVLHTALEQTLTTFAKSNACALTLTPLQTAAGQPPKRLLATLQPGHTGQTVLNPLLAVHASPLRHAVLVENKSIY